MITIDNRARLLESRLDSSMASERVSCGFVGVEHGLNYLVGGRPVVGGQLEVSSNYEVRATALRSGSEGPCACRAAGCVLTWLARGQREE